MDRAGRRSASTRVASRTSRTSRQIAPCTEMSCASRPRSADALGLNAGTRPKVGFTVATPHANEGKRSDPPMSFPWWMGPNPIAAAADAPPEEPPGDASSSHGLKVLPRSGLSVVPRMESSGVLVRPTMIAPASRRLRTTGESSGAMRSANAGRPFVVACPVTSTFSLMVTGTPCNGPSASPPSTSRSFRSAARNASSEQSATIALMRPLCTAMRPSTDSITSTHDTSRARIIAASSTALRLHRPRFMPIVRPSLPLERSRHAETLLASVRARSIGLSWQVLRARQARQRLPNGVR